MAKEVDSGKSDAETHYRPGRRLPRPGGHPAQRRPAAAVPEERQAPLRPVRAGGRPPPARHRRRRRRLPAPHPRASRAHGDGRAPRGRPAYRRASDVPVGRDVEATAEADVAAAGLQPARSPACSAPSRCCWPSCWACTSDDRHVDLGLGDLRRALWESPTAFFLIASMLAPAGRHGPLRPRGQRRRPVPARPGALRAATGQRRRGADGRVPAVVGRGLRGAWSLVAFLGLVFLLGGLGGTVGMSGYLWVTNCLGFHGNEGYAPLHHMDLKHFLRLHVDADGGLTVYPIGVDRVGRHWELRPDDPPAAPWFAPSVAGRAPPHRGADPRSGLLRRECRPGRVLGVGVQALAGARLPARPAGQAVVRALRRPVRHRRDQQQLLPAADRGGGRGVGGPGPAGVRVRAEAGPVRVAPDEAEGRRRRGCRTTSTGSSAWAPRPGRRSCSSRPAGSATPSGSTSSWPWRPSTLRWAVELREASWLHEETYEVLRRHGAALCIHDLLAGHPWELTTDWTYVRFHGPRATEAAYQGRYGPDGLSLDGRAPERLAGRGMRRLRLLQQRRLRVRGGGRPLAAPTAWATVRNS